MELTYLIGTFVITLLLGVPIYGVMGLSVLVYFFATGLNPLTMPQQMLAGLDVFVLLAVPLFMLAGGLMNQGGTTRRLMSLADAMVGWLRGGLAYVNIVVSMLFAGKSGSATADTSAVGAIMIPSMRERGYTPEFATAVTVASSTIGPIIPPSIALIIFAVVAQVSVAELFLAGIVPGILLGVAQMMTVAVYSLFLGFPTASRFSLSRLALCLLDALIPLALPFIILGGIFSGLFTPTEAAAVACLYAFLVGKFVYREIKWHHLPTILLDSAKATGSALIIVSVAAPFAWILSRQGVPTMVAQWILGITENPIVLLILINVVLLLLGTFMELIAAMIIMVPILLPIVVSIGIDPVHFGVIIALNLTLGLITPPVGICLFIGSSIAKLPLERVALAVAPFLGVSVLVLFIITFIPQLVMWLPEYYRN